MKMLKQSTAFCPFMKQFIAFAYVASGASKHKIRGIVCSSSGHRYDVVNMIVLWFEKQLEVVM